MAENFAHFKVRASSREIVGEESKRYLLPSVLVEAEEGRLWEEEREKVSVKASGARNSHSEAETASSRRRRPD